jgi:hypothetical protein
MATSIDEKQISATLLVSNKLVATVAGEVVLYTPTPGYRAVVLFMVVKDASLTLAAATSLAFGTNAGTRNDWGTSTARTLLPVSSSLIALPLYPTVPADSVGQSVVVVPAGGNFGVKFTTGTTNGATATFDIFGYEFI